MSAGSAAGGLRLYAWWAETPQSGTALAISALFVVAGLAAVFGTAGFIFATVMSVAEAIWIPAAAIAFARRTARDGS